MPAHHLPQPAGQSQLSRRRLLQGGLVAGTAGTLGTGVAAPTTAAAAEASSSPYRGSSRDRRASNAAAYDFLDQAMDAYSGGAEPRLAQSHADQIGLFSTAFVYDQALAINAYLERGHGDDLARAKHLGDSLIFAQQHDPNHNDGRVRQAYNVGPYVFYDGNPQPDRFVRSDGKANVGSQFGFTGSAVGDLAWAGIAQAQLFARTGLRRYLDSAIAFGEWIVANAQTTSGQGGYLFGVDGGNNPQVFKSTEHNIDVVGFFGLLRRLTGNPAWQTRADHARAFVVRMWNADAGMFFTGSRGGDDDLTEGGPDSPIQPPRLPEDPQSWSWLAMRDQTYAASVDWAKTNLATTDTPECRNSSLRGNRALTGVTFSDASLVATEKAGQFDPDPCPNAVWFEGTGQMAAALLDRNARAGEADLLDDRELAAQYLATIGLAQRLLGAGQTFGGKLVPLGTGVVAASSVLNTGYGFSYFPMKHVGATAWFLIATHQGNPYQLG
jgi:hypothetical protein